MHLQRVMDPLIRHNQTGFLPGRTIGDSVRAAEDALEIVQEQYPEGMLVALNFSKAFDSVRWSLIVRALQLFNFGESFIEYVQVLFVHIQSCVYNAGKTSETFSPGRGIRQGCPVSPYIFILVAELLAILIRENSNIKGISLGPSEAKLIQFADDVTCFIATEDSLSNLMHTLNLFASWSGLVVNTNKTKIICPRYLLEGKTHIMNMPIVAKAKVLGIWLGLDNSESNCYEWNFKKQLERIRTICESWNHRNLSLKGKITVSNALLISILQYPTSVSFTPERVLKEYRKITTDFLWNGRKPKIAHNTIIQTVENGGLKLLDLGIRVQVNLLQWVRRVTAEKDMNLGEALRHLLRTTNLKQYLSYRNPPTQIPIGRHKIYQEMLKVWRRFRNFEPDNESTIRK